MCFLLHPYVLTSIVRSPYWEAISHSTSKKIYLPIWYSKFNCSIYHSLVSFLSQINPVHTLFSSIRFNIILVFMLTSFSDLFPSGFPARRFYALHILSMNATFTAHLILFDLIILITYRDEQSLWSPSLLMRFWLVTTVSQYLNLPHF